MMDIVKLQEKIDKLKQKPWRRLLIVAVLVCFFMFLSSSLWLNNSITVSFNANTSKDLTFQVFYATNPKANFNGKDTVKQFVNVGFSKVVFKLPIKNIVKLRIDPGSNSGKVKISDIEVSGSKVIKLTDYNLWTYNSHIESHSVEDGVLTLISNQEDPYIIYKQELNIPEGIEIDWCLFTISLAFSIFVSSVLVFYLSRFKILELRSRIEIVFLAVFFGLLFIPMSNISDADKSIQENRMLAKFPSLYVNGKLNKAYGTDFEKWFNDRFFGRSLMLNVDTYFVKLVNNHFAKGDTYIGKDNWMFLPDDFYNYKLSKAEIDKIVNNISSFRSFCQDNGIKCYIEIAPRKAEFAADKGNKKLEEDNVDRAKIIAKEVKDKTGFEIIYPLDDMKEANRQDFVYFKTDHHWTEWGAYIGYQALMRRIRKDFPEIIPVTESDFDIFYDNKIRAEIERKFWQGSGCNNLGLSVENCPLHTKYRYYKHKNEKKLLIRKDDNMNKFFNYPANNNLKAMVIGNSFTENFSSFMAYTFSEYIKLRSNNSNVDNLKLSRWEDLILKENPDILVLVFESRYIYKLIDLY